MNEENICEEFKPLIYLILSVLWIFYICVGCGLLISLLD